MARDRIDPAQPRTEDTAGPEQGKLREAGLEVQLPDGLRALRDHVVGAFSDLEVLGFRGELTLVAPVERLIELLTFCRDDRTVGCEYLMDLSAVHWPGGKVAEQAHETTGWPTLYTERPGRIEVDYILSSVTHNHRFRVRVEVPDEDAVLPTAAKLYGSANFMEREVYDFFGVRFEGHPNLARILMPDQWEGHPHRKDYPLGGVHVQYKGAMIPPPDERKY
ncbi:MAG: NADH-quinone oxidoreductase subunit C [Nitriliruptorales bacterium]|nr:NADH-quinone oxidoreductase subunit C [Nitriliruptorales bacterium]